MKIKRVRGFVEVVDDVLADMNGRLPLPSHGIDCKSPQFDAQRIMPRKTLTDSGAASVELGLNLSAPARRSLTSKQL